MDDFRKLEKLKQQADDATSKVSFDDFLKMFKDGQGLDQPAVTIPYRKENDDTSMLPPLGLGIGGQQEIVAMPSGATQDESVSMTPPPEENIISKLKALAPGISRAPALAPVQPRDPNISSPQAVTATAPTSLVDQKFIDAQEQSRQNRMNAGMQLASAQIGKGIASLGAGGKVDVDTSGQDHLMKTADAPMQDLAAGRKSEKEFLDLMDDQKKNDPKSEVSQLYRTAFEKLGVKIGSNATAAELEKASPTITNAINAQLTRESHKLQYAALAEQKAEKGKLQGDAAQQKKMDNVAKAMTTFRGDPAAAKASDALRRAEMAQRLLDKPEWSKEERELFAGELSSLVKGGVPTEHELKNILPDTSAAQLAKAMTFITNEPQNVNDDAYRKRMSHYLGELKEINQEYLDARKEKIISLGGYKHFSEEMKDLIRTEEPRIAAKLDGKPFQAEEVHDTNPTKGTITQNTLAEYAKKHNMDVGAAQKLLTKSGYVIR